MNSRRGMLKLSLVGQVRGGKNSVAVTRTGRRYPNKLFAAWRDAQVAVVRSQLPPGHEPIAWPCGVCIEYTPEDRRWRDVPAVIDAIWHVLEAAGVVADDRWLGARWVLFEQREPSRGGAGAIVRVVDQSRLTANHERRKR